MCDPFFFKITQKLRLLIKAISLQHSLHIYFFFFLIQRACESLHTWVSLILLHRQLQNSVTNLCFLIMALLTEYLRIFPNAAMDSISYYSNLLPFYRFTIFQLLKEIIN